jgi:hypothetical protein
MYKELTKTIPNIILGIVFFNSEYIIIIYTLPRGKRDIGSTGRKWKYRLHF